MYVTKTKLQISDSLEIELLALLWGLQLCAHLEIHELFLESDSQLVVQAIQARKDSYAMQINLIVEIKKFQRFNQCHP